jgi:hypothetical protein
MSITTYAELQSSIADWLLRDDLTSVIPTFISLAEAKFNRRIRDYRMVKRATAQVDTPYFAIPSDWQENIRFQLNTSPITTLEYVTPDQAAEEKRLYNSSGRPAFFTMIGDQFQIVPAPDSQYDAELTYYSKIPALSGSNTSNWLLEKAPDIYLYGALMEAAPYLDDDARIQVWGGLLEQSMNAIQIESDRAKTGSSSIRMRAKAMA